MPAIRRSGARRKEDSDRPFEETSKAWQASGFSEAGGRVPTMASLPADEDYARSVLAIFGARRVRPRESLAAGDVKAAFLVQNMGSPADFEAALQHAASEGFRIFPRMHSNIVDQISYTIGSHQHLQN
jgi:hypothetical protein